MATVESRLTTKPKTTSNNLRDVIDWLKEGDYVVIHNNYLHGRFFHSNCIETPNIPVSDLTDQMLLNNRRIIYVDVKSMPGLLDEGEWEYYIKLGGFSECKCHLKETVSNGNGLAHTYHLKLGY